MVESTVSYSIEEIGVPDWARGVVWYQIFPERFRNGDPRNDPVLSSLEGADPHDLDSPWQVHPWTSEWYRMQAYERATGLDRWQNILRRRYGGDLQGVIDKIPYLVDLGIGAIYLNPIFTSPSLHKYDGATYHHIDPHLGPDPVGDKALIESEVPHDPRTWHWTAADRLFLELVEKLHENGIRIIIDGVFNHVGIRHWAFQDVVRRQSQSPYADWFDIRSWPDEESGTGLTYKCWWDVPELPEWARDGDDIARGPREYIFEITRRWMDPAGDGDLTKGIDGWRLDVAFCVSHTFWKAWRRHVKQINRQAYLVAEVVDTVAENKPYLEGDEFDAVMNYNFAFACAEFFVEEETGIKVSEFDRRLRELREAFPQPIVDVQQNLLNSHDSDRFASHIVNRKLGGYRKWMEYHERSRARNGSYDTRKPTADERTIQKLVVIFQMTYPGAPMVYYGDEAGMWGANDPCCRKPMVWDDFEYEPETVGPDGRPLSHPMAVAIDAELHDHYRRMIRLRNDVPALRIGAYRTLVADDERSVFVFERSLDGDRVVVAVNNAPEEQRVGLELGNGRFVDLLGGGEYISPGKGTAMVTIAPRWAAVLRRAEP